MKIEIDSIMLYIAEVLGVFKPGTGGIKDKIQSGRNAYIANTLPVLDLTKSEDRKDLHELIVCERLYNELDEYFSITKCCKLSRRLSIDTGNYREAGYQFQVPIELDASCSMVQIMSVLLNDKRMMEMTNVIGEVLEDPWHIEGISRKMLKCAATPQMYGSSQTCSDLWKKNKMKFTDKDIELYNKEMAEGAFGLANDFKNFIINNCNIKPTMDIKIGEAEFVVDCNRFRNVGEKMKAYKIWDSNDKTYNTLLHTDTHKVADLEQFKRFWPTCLIHHLDSVIMDNVCSKVMEKYGWGIPLHDAILCGAQAAADVREWYGQELCDIHNNRESILKGFFKSMGVTGEASEEWKRLKSKVVPFTGNLEEELRLSMPLK